MIVKHPDWSSNLENDVALLRLATPVTLGSHVATIDLAVGDDGPGSIATVSGWGNTSPSSGASNVLRKAKLPIISNVDCDAATGLSRDLFANEVCAGDLVVSQGGCHGDDGGPLALERGPEHWDLVGVVSWGSSYDCNTYTVFARVSSHRAWITDTIQNPRLGFTDVAASPLHASWSGVKTLGTGDFNGDGKTDLYLNYDNLGAGASQHIWYGRTTPGFDDHGMPPLHASWSGSRILGTGDFNGDGKTDLYLNYGNLGAGASQHIWYGRPTPGFADHEMPPLHASWSGVKILGTGDFNGDGKTDLYLNYDNLGAGASHHIWYGRSTPGFDDHGMPPLHASWSGVRILGTGDFNGDGKTDLYLNYGNLGAGASQHIWYGRTTPGFDDHGMPPLHASWSGIKILGTGDFNGDGKTDLYLNYDNLGAGASHHIWYGRSTPGFDDHGMPPLPSSWSGYRILGVGDFSGDSRTDLYLNHSNLGGGAVQHVWYGN